MNKELAGLAIIALSFVFFYFGGDGGFVIAVFLILVSLGLISSPDDNNHGKN